MLTFVGFGFQTDIFIVSDDRLETAKSPNSSDKVNEALRNEDTYKEVTVC